MFKIGDTVIHPGYGICKIRATKMDEAERAEVYVLRPRVSAPGDFKILIPKSKIKETGVHYPVHPSQVDKLLEILKEEPNDLAEDSKKGYPNTKQKILTGEPLKTAEVVRDLKSRNDGMHSSIGNELLHTAKKTLMLEIALVRKITQERAAAWITSALNKR